MERLASECFGLPSSRLRMLVFTRNAMSAQSLHPRLRGLARICAAAAIMALAGKNLYVRVLQAIFSGDVYHLNHCYHGVLRLLTE